jgi:hypothetical protein
MIYGYFLALRFLSVFSASLSTSPGWQLRALHIFSKISRVLPGALPSFNRHGPLVCYRTDSVLSS